MNTYQKIAIFILRISAVAMLVMALMGGCAYAIYAARGTVDAQMSLKFVGTIVWFVAGLFLGSSGKRVVRA